jgi:hypothetical protein
MLNLTSETLVQLLKLQQLGELFPDYPKNFIPPALTDPNYVPPYRGQFSFNASVVMSALLLVVVPLRLLVRLRLRTSTWGWDDTLIILATMLALTVNSLGVFELYRAGVGRHAYDDTYAGIKLAYTLQFLHFQLYTCGASIAKLSVCAFYLRLLCAGKAREAVKYFMGFIFILCVITVIAIFLPYRPVKAAWDIDALLQPHSGSNFRYRLFVLSIIYAIVDFILWFIPIPIVWGLHTRPGKRLALVALFSLGFLSCVAIVVRTTLLWNNLNTYDGTCKLLIYPY